jgi:hypothetical protein
VILIAAAADLSPSIQTGLWDVTTLLALDRATGRKLWSRRAKHRFHNHAVALADGMVFAIDSASPLKDKMPQRGQQQPILPSTVLALDAHSGEQRWSTVTMNRFQPFTSAFPVQLRNSDDWLGYCRELHILLTGKSQDTHAFDARSGKELWHEPVAGQPMIICGERFMTQRGQPFDTRTGKPLGRAPINYDLFGCNYAVANPYLMMFRHISASYLDLETGKDHQLYAARSGCSNSLVAADGLLNSPCFSVGCVCNYPMQTSFALVHVPED